VFSNTDWDAEIEEHYQESAKERIAILCSYAAYNASLGHQAQDKVKQEEFWLKADEYYAKADNIDPADENVLVGKGFLYFCRRDYKRAGDNFNLVRDVNEKNVPAMLGTAALQYNSGKYHEALQVFQNVIKADPGCPANVRLGIALCLHHLKEPASALKAFERVIELEPENVEAIAALAVLQLNSNKVEKGMQSMARAMKLAPRNATIINHVANHLFYQGKYDQVVTLAEKALEFSDATLLQAESQFQLARAYQAKEDYPKAHQHYAKSTELNPDGILAQYGLGQMHIYKKEPEMAMTCFERVLAKDRDCWEAMRLLGALYARDGRREEAHKHLKRVTTHNPRDSDAWTELAEIYATKDEDSAAAKQAYRRAVKLLRKQQGLVPRELCNNYGVVLHKCGDHQEAIELYCEALGGFPTEGQDKSKLYEPNNLTVTYNVARVFEDTKRIEEATELYLGILEAFPHYTDCYLRLAALDILKENLGQAAKQLNEASRRNPENLGTMISFGNLHLKADEFGPAQKRFEQGLHIDKYDQYALISLGNVFLHSYRPDAENSKSLDRAMDYYSRVLRRNPNNIFAAQGIACTLAEKGRFRQAKEVFDLVQEGTTESADTLVNLAHCYLQAGLHVQAVNTYQKCLKKFHGGDTNVELLQFLARAHYDANEFDHSLASFEKAAALAPEDQSIRFNIAVARYRYSRKLLDAAGVTLPQVAVAKVNLIQAKGVMEELFALLEKEKEDRATDKDNAEKSQPKLAFGGGRVQHWIERCALWLEKVGPIEDEIKKTLALKKERVEHQRTQYEKVIQARKDREAEAEVLQAKKLEDDEKMAGERAEKLKQMSEGWKAQSFEAIQAEAEKNTKKKKKEDLEVMEVEEEANKQALPEGLESPSPSPEREGDEASKDGTEKKKGRLKRMRDSDDDDDDDDAKTGGEAPADAAPAAAGAAEGGEDAEGTKKKKKKGIVMEDSDDE